MPSRTKLDSPAFLRFIGPADGRVSRPGITEWRLPARLQHMAWQRSSGVEQGNHNPLVGSSNLSAATIYKKKLSLCFRYLDRILVS